MPMFQPQDRVLLVAAHPDDETMFFSPVLNHLRNTLAKPAQQIHLLCASTGNAMGLGKVRCKELVKAAGVYGISPDSLTILDEPGLQDGMDQAWDRHLLSHTIRETVQRHNINYILTFDQEGVTHHPNHIMVHLAVRQVVEYTGVKKPECFKAAYSLRTYPVLLNYMGSLMWLLLLLLYFLQWMLPPQNLQWPRKFQIIRPSHGAVYRAMQSHKSQLTWYRLCHVIWSR
eukprot:Protomagalhaensia_wolfi_Nauph_80__991@NODE_1571_length_1462_cov_1635_486297_g1217_i0_p1_GENE_NODE_1571_length_1462_cov_1635_486297_g1217_i0NODE_1571_length_1462_cov_1635_486297_g1217_i0_p1_ORF_typecomplete_len246_score23_48PIGL/PF02585_17/9_5e31_NODE_1571_length_1462_cov_1635_486297_g1217_i052738